MKHKMKEIFTESFNIYNFKTWLRDYENDFWLYEISNWLNFYILKRKIEKDSLKLTEYIMINLCESHAISFIDLSIS